MKHERGFTLLEVLVGTAILSMMVFMIWSVSSTNLDAQDRVMKRDEIFQMGRLVIEKITSDINMVFLVTNSELLGVTKDGSKVETAFVGDDKGQFDSLDFNSFSHWRMFRDIKESDQAELGYYVESDEVEKGHYRLMRRESSYLDNDTTKGGKAFPLADGISEFQLSYYDGGVRDWTDSWNSNEVDNKNKLPRAVKITVSFPDPDNDEERISFTTIALIELWQYPIEF